VTGGWWWYLNAISPNLLSTRKFKADTEVESRKLGVESNGTISTRGNERHRLVGLRRGDARHSLKHVATRLLPAEPHTNIQCRNRRRQKKTFKPSAPPRRHYKRPQLTTGKSPQGPRVTVQIEQHNLCSAAQLKSCSSSAAAASRLTSSALPHVSLGASQLLKHASTAPRSYGRRHLSWHYEPQA
jgi:hypothetical protein